MIVERNIKWFLDQPQRLMEMKPFTRGGNLITHGFEKSHVYCNTKVDTGLTSLELQPISQDVYLTEYHPDLHHIKINQSIPHIQVRLDNKDLPMGIMDMTETASFQKLIHSAHCRSLTGNPLEFNLFANDIEQGGAKMFEEIKAQFLWRDLDYAMSQAINACKQVGNCGVLFSFDKETRKYSVTNYSYEDGYQIVPNYNEYGVEIARSLVYQIDGQTVIDTYDQTNHYRCMTDESGTWKVKGKERHGFSRCPLLHKRGKVAWEYAESAIEMYELMMNINAIALKRFGTFALVFIGDMDAGSFKKDSSTLIINLSSDTTNGKQDAKVLDFPEPTTMNDFLDRLKVDISLNSSTSFITPKDISSTGTGGNGIALAMSNDYALAVQSANDWKPFVNEMVRLHQEGVDLENGGTNKYGKLHIGTNIIPWSLETNNTKITNLQMESNWLSTKTIIEKSPNAAPDEMQRVIAERGSLIPRQKTTNQQSNDGDGDGDDKDTRKAVRISKNRSNIIVDNK